MRARLPAALGALGEFVFSAFLVGAATGAADSWLARRLFGEAISLLSVIDAVVVYSVLWTLIGLAVFGVLALGDLLRRRTPAAIPRRHPPLLLFSCLSLFLLGLTILNKKYLPVAHSAPSLAFDLGWFLFSAGIYFLARRFLAPAVSGGRRVLLLGSACALILLAVAAAGKRAVVPSDAGDVPNVVILLIDNVRADHLHCYGYPRPISPDIDAFSREGVLFSRAYAAAPWTLPSVVSLLTALYPSEHGTHDHRFRLSGEVPTLLGAMKEHNYQVGVFSNSPWISLRYGIGGEADYFDRPYLSIHHALYFLNKYSPFRLDNRFGGRFLLSDRGLTARFLDWSESVIGREGKFFAYLHLMGPHVPYAAPAGYRKELGLESVPRLNPPGYGGLFSFVEQPALSARELEELTGNYDAALLYGQEVVGQLVRGLEELGIRQDTLVILTADHGEEFYEHGGWYHGDSLFEEMIRVPLIMAWPGHFPEGLRIDEPVSQVDIMPMVLGLLRREPPARADVRDLVARARESDGLGPDFIYSEVVYKNRGGRALREGRYKLVHGYHDDGNEVFLLFDLERDPGELTDLMEEDPEIAGRLQSELRRLQDQLREPRAGMEAAGIDHLTDRRLRSLGYLR